LCKLLYSINNRSALCETRQRDFARQQADNKNKSEVKISTQVRHSMRAGKPKNSDMNDRGLAAS